MQPGAQGEALVGQRVAQLAGVHGGGYKADNAHLGRGGVAQHAHAAQGGQARAQVARQRILVLLDFLPVRQREARSNQQARNPRQVGGAAFVAVGKLLGLNHAFALRAGAAHHQRPGQHAAAQHQHARAVRTQQSLVTRHGDHVRAQRR